MAELEPDLAEVVPSNSQQKPQTKDAFTQACVITLFFLLVDNAIINRSLNRQRAD